MMHEPKLIAAPTSEPISAALARQHLRVDALDDGVESAAQDEEIERYIKSARRLIEKTCGLTVHQTTWEIALDRWPDSDYIALPRATPLISVTSLKYLGTTGLETTVSSSLYLADAYPTPGRLALAFGQSWPSAALYPASPIRVRYLAGIVTASPVSDADALIRQAMFLLVGGMWENRESEVVTDLKFSEAIIMAWGVNKILAELTVHEC